VHLLYHRVLPSRVPAKNQFGLQSNNSVACRSARATRRHAHDVRLLACPHGIPHLRASVRTPHTFRARAETPSRILGGGGPSHGPRRTSELAQTIPAWLCKFRLTSLAPSTGAWSHRTRTHASGRNRKRSLCCLCLDARQADVPNEMTTAAEAHHAALWGKHTNRQLGPTISNAATRCRYVDICAVSYRPRRTRHRVEQSARCLTSGVRESIVPTCHQQLNIRTVSGADRRRSYPKQKGRRAATARTPAPAVGWLAACLPSPAGGAAPRRDPVTALLPGTGGAPHRVAAARWRRRRVGTGKPLTIWCRVGKKGGGRAVSLPPARGH
jgi:hypothetical protein